MADETNEATLKSARELNNRFQPLEDTVAWLNSYQTSTECSVTRIPLTQLQGWYFDEQSGDLRHESGKFFTIMGLTCVPKTEEPWQQPIILQPEVGILGIVSRIFDGVRYFLMQAKMEPGNINRYQLSPTLQATYSNYTQTHKGKRPPYLDLFLDESARTICDQLQSETGTRFFQKFNRNTIIEIEYDIDLAAGFRWMTLAEIQVLMGTPDAINMDARSVLSNLPMGTSSTDDDLVQSAVTTRSERTASTTEEARQRLIAWQREYQIEARRIPLNEVSNWTRNEWSITHEKKNFFEVCGVSVQANDREVRSWTQPILRHEGIGLTGFICQRMNGLLHFLMQAKPEPGIVASVELAPTISTFDYENRAADSVPFLDFFQRLESGRVRFDNIVSEEGGRFWNLRNRVVVVELDSMPKHDLPDRYLWLTLGQIHELSQGNSIVNSEARTLLSCMRFEGMCDRSRNWEIK